MKCIFPPQSRHPFTHSLSIIIIIVIIIIGGSSSRVVFSHSWLRVHLPGALAGWW